MSAARLLTRSLPLAAVVLLVAAGCGSADSAGEETPAQGTWGSMAAAEPHLMLSGGGELEGHDGCNSLAGTWSAEGTTVEFSELSSTEMACPDADTWLHEARSAEIQGDTLVVKDAHGEQIGTLQRVDG